MKPHRGNRTGWRSPAVFFRRNRPRRSFAQGGMPRSRPRDLPRLDKRADTLGEIRRACARRSDDTLEIARLVGRLHAESRAVRGKWSELIRSGQLPFKKRKAEQTVRIGRECGQANAHDRAHFPSASRTLYCLALLGWAAVRKLLRAGRIHPGLSLKEARALLVEHNPGIAKPKTFLAFRKRLDRFAAFVRANATALSSGERQRGESELLRLAKEISG
jgi:hypothetical protein